MRTRTTTAACPIRSPSPCWPPPTGLGDRERTHAPADRRAAGTPGALPSRSAGKAGRPFACHRRTIEGVVCRCRTGTGWRDLFREASGPRQTAWKRRRRWAAAGTSGSIRSRIASVIAVRTDTSGQLANRSKRHALVVAPPAQYVVRAVEAEC
ncbi:transposase [Streptomyces desertarenae]|uniref:Transposase n=1 Tax=Streptomyces desertarenae TaxID=2666184 RepID=A0ABW4PSV9_9ACTN